jgi:hypothetical protein
MTLKCIVRIRTSGGLSVDCLEKMLCKYLVGARVIVSLYTSTRTRLSFICNYYLPLSHTVVQGGALHTDFLTPSELLNDVLFLMIPVVET